MLEIAIEKMTGRHLDDSQLLKELSQGDEGALAVLYSRYGSKLYGYALRILGDPVRAEDVLQDSLVAIWQEAKRFRGEGRVVAWMFGIVHNKAMRTFREKKNAPLDESAQGLETMEAQVDEKIISRERKAILRSGLEALSVEHRTVLELVFYQEMTMKEISQICQIPVGTVKSRLNHAKAALKGILSRQGAAMEDLK
jgi:RNA polymerase sigma-70 factor (ECF subfamily)